MRVAPSRRAPLVLSPRLLRTTFAIACLVCVIVVEGGVGIARPVGDALLAGRHTSLSIAGGAARRALTQAKPFLLTSGVLV